MVLHFTATSSLFLSNDLCCAFPLRRSSTPLSPVTVGALTLTSDTASDAVDLDRSRVVVVDAEADNSNLSSTSSTRLSLTDSVGEFSDSEIEDENTPPRDPELLL